VTKPVPYRRLRKLLLQLDFQETVVRGSHIVFRHPEPDTLLIYRDYRPEETISAADMAVTRRFLDAWGLVEADTFETVLEETHV
jgi:predicted RNA binding protein YcfA (HicA-like mRNA interferase family)